MAARAPLLMLACAAAIAAAAETTAWPPAADVAARMRELQEQLGDPRIGAAQREAAREELSSLLKSPAGQARGRTPDEKPARPARAAIEPHPSVVKPSIPAPEGTPGGGSPPGVARIEVIEPPKPVIDPRTGAAVVPQSRFAVDPRTGRVLHEAPGGFIDPATGRFVPR